MLSLVSRHKSFTVLLATIVLLELAHGIEIVTLLPLYLTRHFGTGDSFVGVVASVYLFVDALLTRAPAGWLADRRGRKPILALGVILSLVPIPFMALAADPNLYLPLNAVNGLGAGMVWPAIYALVADQYGREQRGTVLALVNMVMLGGLAAGGPISGSILLQALGYPDPSAYPRAFIACALFVSIALVLVLAFVRESPIRHGVKSEFDRSPREESEPAPDGLTFSLLLAIGLFITLALGLIVPVLTLFGTNVLKLSLGGLAIILIPPALTAALVLVPAGRWADRHGRHAPLVAGLALIAIPFWGAALTVQPAIVSLGGCLAALGYALLVPAWNALIMDWIPARRRGLFLGGVATVQGLGLAAGPALGGRLFELDPYAPFWAAGAFLSLGAFTAIFLALPLRRRKERLA